MAPTASRRIIDGVTWWPGGDGGPGERGELSLLPQNYDRFPVRHGLPEKV